MVETVDTGANMCGACLKEQVDVTEGIPKKGLVVIQVCACDVQ